MDNNFYDNNELLSLLSVQTADNIIEYLIQNGSDILYDKYLQTHQPFYESSDICDQCYNIVKQCFQTNDEGETKQDLQMQWKEDREPELQKLDNRAVLSTKVEFVIHELDNEDDISDTKSVMSNASRISGISRSAITKMQKVITGSQFIGRPTQTNLSRTSFQGQDMLQTQQQEKVEEKPQFQIISCANQQELNLDNDPVSERLRDMREKKDKEKQLEQSRKQKNEKEEQEANERKTEALRQMKSKDFTQDYDGKIIFLNKNNNNSKSDQQFPPEIIPIEPNQSKIQQEILKFARAEDTIPQEQVRLQDEFMKKKKENKYQLATQEFNKQPQLNDQIKKPNVGVKITFANNQKKQGDKFFDQNRMNKKEYEKVIQQASPTKYIIHKQIDSNGKIIEEVTESNLSTNQQQHRKLKQKYGIKIQNQDKYKMMLADNQPMPIREDDLENSFNSQKNQQEEEKIEKEKKQNVVIKGDRIKVYDKVVKRKSQIIIENQLDFNKDFGINMQAIQEKNNQNINQIIDKFNQKMLKDPNWGEIKTAEGEQKQILPKLVAPIPRVQSAKFSKRPDSGLSRVSVKSMKQSNYQSNRPTTAYSKGSQNQKSSFFQNKI